MSERTVSQSQSNQPSQASTRVWTVLGPAAPKELGTVDAHAHVWIEPVPSAAPGSPVLDDRAASLEELSRFRNAGGGAIADCQPYGCGRNGRVLADLSRESGVRIVACTGFHLRKYYTAHAAPWCWSEEQAANFFTLELTRGLSETLDWTVPVRAGFIKVACEASVETSAQHLLRAAAEASRCCGAALEIHTEKGQDADQIVAFFAAQQVDPRRLVLCHIDKRPDFGLHRELAQAGVLLEYDTFYRSKYEPEKNLWPLLENMVAAGLDGSLALAADLADSAEWTVNGGHPGLPGLLNQVRPRLLETGIPGESAARLLGGNIAARLARTEIVYTKPN
jgi:phosphotriesterase-related protein